MPLLTLRALFVRVLFSLAFLVFAGAAQAQTNGGDGPNGGAPSAPAAPAGHGFSGSFHRPTAVAGACGAIELPDPSPFADAGDAVRALSEAAKAHVEACACAGRDCIADVLDAYAAKLAVVAPRLPARLRNLPSVVSKAAKRVRAAKSLREAVKVLRVAVTTVNKEIELIRAGGSETASASTRGGELVADTLEFAAARLERAAGI